MKVLYIVVPCYNEEEVIDETSKRLVNKLNQLIDQHRISENSRILFINDGSIDLTWPKIKELNKNHPLISGVNLSRNVGHQNALLAGLIVAKEHADITISIDADLQDDIEVINHFIDKYEEGHDIVYGVRNERKKDTFFKRFTAVGFYRLMKKMGVEIVFNHADYRLMSRRAIIALEQFKEVNLFLRGLVPLIGFKTATVEYERHERFAGESKYPLKKMLSFAIDGITSFSIKPIRLITFTGFMTFIISIAMLIYFFVQKYLGNVIAGWTSTIVSIWAIGGLNLLAIGIIGEYIGKVYLETKSRPKYFIERVLLDEEE